MDEIPEENKGNSLYHASISSISRLPTTRKTPTSDDDVAFVFHEAEHPYNEIRRTKTQKEHFQAAVPVVDQRPEEDRDEYIQLAVMFTAEEHKTPCKLVKLTNGKYFHPSFDEREIFRNCFLTEKNNILLFTRYYTMLYDDNFNLLTQIDKKSLHEHVWRTNCCQPSVSGEDRSSYILACEMKNVSSSFVISMIYLDLPSSSSKHNSSGNSPVMSIKARRLKQRGW